MERRRLGAAREPARSRRDRRRRRRPARAVPHPGQYHCDPEGETAKWLGRPAPRPERYTWRATSPDWVAFAERCTPRELALFGFPPPGHAIWDAELIVATAIRYPKLDLTPWRAALGIEE